MPRKSRSDEAPTYGRFDNWPVNNGPARKIFVAAALETDLALLKARNFEPVDVLTMNRDTPEKDQDCIEAWLQGMSEGSIILDEERRKSLMDEAKVKGYLISKSVREVKHIAEGTLDQLLNFGASRHTMNRAPVEKIEAAKKAATTPGEKVKH